MPARKLKDTDTYVELKYNDTNKNYTNDEEYFLLPGNFDEYKQLCGVLVRESKLLFGANNKYIKDGIYDYLEVLVVNHEKLLSVLSYFASSPRLNHVKIKVTGPIQKKDKDGKLTTVLETMIIDSSKAFDYKYASVFSKDKRTNVGNKFKR